MALIHQAYVSGATMTTTDDITWCENENKYMRCSSTCFLHDECHPKKVMNVDIPADIDRESMEIRIDDSVDDDFIPRTTVDREWLDQRDRAASVPGYNLVFTTPASSGTLPKQKTIAYDDISDAMRMGQYMRDKKFKEGTPVAILKDGVVFMKWSANGKSWTSIPQRGTGNGRRGRSRSSHS